MWKPCLLRFLEGVSLQACLAPWPLLPSGTRSLRQNCRPEVSWYFSHYYIRIVCKRADVLMRCRSLAFARLSPSLPLYRFSQDVLRKSWGTAQDRSSSSSSSSGLLTPRRISLGPIISEGMVLHPISFERCFDTEPCLTYRSQGNSPGVGSQCTF
jgi:hypothetical protein